MRLAQNILLIVVLYSLVPGQAIGFENLNFEQTLLDYQSLVDDRYYPRSPDDGDPSIVTPGWSYRSEWLDYTVVGAGCEFDCGHHATHGSLIDGHIGLTEQVIMFVNGRVGRNGSHVQNSLEGLYSLDLGASAERPPLEATIPVAVQTGIVPAEAKSIRLRVERSRMPANEPPDFFTIRLNGHNVDMWPVEFIPRLNPSDYPRGWQGLNILAEFNGEPIPYPPAGIASSVVYAGNVESVAGRFRELSIRPEPYFEPMYQDFAHASMIFDDVVFSPLPAPGLPVQIPEPATVWLVAIGGGMRLALQRAART